MIIKVKYCGVSMAYAVYLQPNSEKALSNLLRMLGMFAFCINHLV